MWLSRVNNSSSNRGNRPLIATKELHNQNENFGYMTSKRDILPLGYGVKFFFLSKKWIRKSLRLSFWLEFWKPNIMWLSRVNNSSSNRGNRPLIATKELHNQNENFGYMTSNESTDFCVLCLHERNIQCQFGRASGKKRLCCKKRKKVDELGRVKGGRNGGRSGAWTIIVRRLDHKIEPRYTGVERLGLKVAAIFF